MIEPISPATKEPALEYLARAPYLNVFISHVLLNDLPSSARRNVNVALDRDRIVGVAYYGRQLVLAAEPAAVTEFAAHGRRHRGERMIVGERAVVRSYWEAVRSWHSPPRLVRDRQFVMMVDRARLKPYQRSTLVRHAKMEDWKAVAESSAEMVRQELDYDPRRGSADFTAGIRQMIERRLWWMATVDDRPCFFCNVGPWCKKTVQLQGIWTPPQLRGRGLATASLAAICDRLLEASPTVSLYVNDFNEEAVALYRRVGFERVGEFQTLLF